MHLLDTEGLWLAADCRMPVNHWKPILGVSLKRDGNECHWLSPKHCWQQLLVEAAMVEEANGEVWKWQEKPLLLALSLQLPLLTKFSVMSSSKEIFFTEPAVKDEFEGERQ